MKLSICMMVKDEEKNIEKCLKSLEKLRKAIDSELIIVDTGSKDKTIEIAKKYKPIIYYKEWNDNFSEMRNITISYTKGDWILIIDADECFDSTEEIESFFKTELCNKFGAAAVTVKNYTDIETNTFVINESPRLFKNDGFFRYVNVVHNTPVYKGQCLDLQNTILHHYGYISNDPELMEKKFKRTANMLKKELEKNPEDIYFRFQLSASYQMHEDIKEALEQAEIAYDLIKSKNKNPIEYIYIYTQLAKCYYVNCIYDKAIEICNEGIIIEKENIDLYYILAKALMESNKYNKAANNFEKYFDLLNNYNNLKIRQNSKITVHTVGLVDEAYYNMGKICIKQNKKEEAVEYYLKINGQFYFKKSIEVLVGLYLDLKKLNELKNYYNERVVDNEIYSSIFEAILEEKIDELSGEEQNEVSKQFENSNNVYMLFNQIRINYLENDVNNFVNNVSYLLDSININSTNKFYGKILYQSIKLEVSCTEFISRSLESKLGSKIQYINDIYKDFPELLLHYVKEYDWQGDLESIQTKKVLCRTLILIDAVKNSEEFNAIFNKYLESGFKYIESIYNDEVLNNGPICVFKNEEELFFYYIYNAWENKKTDPLSYVRALKKALSVYPYMKKGIEYLINELLGKEDSMSC